MCARPTAFPAEVPRTITARSRGIELIPLSHGHDTSTHSRRASRAARPGCCGGDLHAGRGATRRSRVRCSWRTSRTRFSCCPVDSRCSRRRHRAPRSVTDRVEYLDLDDVVELARLLLGDSALIRDIGLLGSAVARPQTRLLGEDAYPDLWMKAAALLQSIVNNHALVDGNKRLGWVATAVFLELNGTSVAHASNDSVFEVVMGVAANNPSLGQIASDLRRLGARRPRRR
jgi:death on curing protein